MKSDVLYSVHYGCYFLLLWLQMKLFSFFSLLYSYGIFKWLSTSCICFWWQWDPSLGRYSWHVPWKIQGHVGGTVSYGWPGNASACPWEELEDVSGEMEVWPSLLRLLPLRPDPWISGRQSMDRSLSFCHLLFYLSKFFLNHVNITSPERNITSPNDGL